MLPNPILVSDEKISHDYNKPMWNVVHNKVFTSMGVSLMQDFKKIISGMEGLPRLDISAIAEEIGWVDVEKLAIELGLKYYIGGNYDFENGVRKGILEYESLNEKKFSEEDMKYFYNYTSRNIMKHTDNFGKYLGIDKIFKMWLQQRKPKEYNVKVQMEWIHDDSVSFPKTKGLQPKITNNKIKVTKILS